MGLDIFAYRKLREVPGAHPDDWGKYDSDKYHVIPGDVIDNTEANFPGRTAGLKAGVYTFDEEFSFRAGSYSGYNEWRDDLAWFAFDKGAHEIWADHITKGPFVELINFSDCEGEIGPIVAAKLAKDFADHQEKAKTHIPLHNDPDEPGWWFDRYKEWQKAFEMASDGGSVCFA